MNPYRKGDFAVISILVLIFAFLLGFYGPSLDDHGDEMRQSQILQDAQRQAMREQSRDFAAAKLCREQYGEASFTWSAYGDLVCIPRKGKHVVVAQQ